MSLTDTILIVDDSSFIVEGLVAILKKSYRTLAVYGGQQCLDILTKEKPSIIILDILMEPMDGWETLTRIKENPATRHIPVLMFSAKKISAEEAEEHRISIDDFVSKPVTPKKLIESIEKVLARQKANRLSIESWRSAGISQDRIDTYTSLMTGLEVDRSLLQNMKVQLSLVREDDEKVRTDLEAVIAAIESRIEDEHLLEEELCREMQESVLMDAEVKERAGPVPAMDKSGHENLPAQEDADAADRPELPDSQDFSYDETIPSPPEILFPEVSVSSETATPGIIPVPKICLPEGDIISETTGSVSQVQDEICRESLREDHDMRILAESLYDKPEPEKVPLRYSFSDEILKKNPTAQPNFPEISGEKSVTGVRNSSDGSVPPVMAQKHPHGHELRPFSARTLDNKPVAPDAPIPWAVGSGTDTSSRTGPYRVGRPSETSGVAGTEKRVPVKNVALPSAGFISRIISVITGLFRRQGK